MKIWHSSCCHTGKSFCLSWWDLENPLKHVASCMKFSRLKESVTCCSFIFLGVILKCPSSNVLSQSLRHVERLLDRFSKNRESFCLGGLYMSMISNFFYLFVPKYIAFISMFSLCKFSCLDVVQFLTEKQRPPQKQLLSRRIILYPFIENWLLGKGFFCLLN